VLNKRELIEQLYAHLRDAQGVARRAEAAASEEARDGASASEKRESARVALENQSLAKGQAQRAERTQAELQALSRFQAPAVVRGKVELGAIVEVEDGGEGRTFFLAPVGAGVELAGPGGDGFLSVVTPASPVGRAVLGRSVGESIEVVVRGEPREWTITWIE